MKKSERYKFSLSLNDKTALYTYIMQYMNHEVYKMQVVYGKQHAVIFIPFSKENHSQKKKNVFVLRDDIIIISMKESSTLSQRNKFITENLECLLIEKINEQLSQLEEKTGIKASSWKLRKLNNAWGLCQNKTGVLTFNKELYIKPVECLEYVILHELCHIKEPNHGKRFVKLLDTYMSDWRFRESLCNGNPNSYGMKR